MSQRYEREIDEILRQFDGAPRPLRRPARRGSLLQRLLQLVYGRTGVRGHWGPDQLMLVAYATALIGFAVVALPFLRFLAAPIGLAVLVLFVTGYLGGFFGWSRPSPTWRGRPASHFQSSQPALAEWWNQVLRRWRRRRR